MSRKPTVTAGSGNVFDDIGLPDAEGELFKAELTYQIARQIKTLGLSQSAVAVRLGLSQPDVSRLIKGRRSGFSTDRLLALLVALGLEIDIVVRPAGPDAKSARIRVTEPT